MGMDIGDLSSVLDEDGSPAPAAAAAVASASGASRRSFAVPSGRSTATTAGKAASLHAGPSGEVVAINKRLSERLVEVVPWLVRQHALAVIFAGLCVYVLCALAFAAFFFALGESCFVVLIGDFGFFEMLWLSVHTFSTVGYGSVYPTCGAGNVAVLLESYISMLVQAIVGAYVVFVFMRSRAKVRFSKHCLVSRSPYTTAEAYTAEEEDEDAEADADAPGSAAGISAFTYEVNFRLVRESYTQVRDARLYLEARFSLPDEIRDTYLKGPPGGDASFIGGRLTASEYRGSRQPRALGRAAQQSAQHSVSTAWGIALAGPRAQPTLSPPPSPPPSSPPPLPALPALLPPSAPPSPPSASVSPAGSRPLGTAPNSRVRPVAGNGATAGSSAAEASTSSKTMQYRDQRCELELTASQMSSLDFWHVTHRITPSSPLWPIRHCLRKHLKAIDVSLSAYDTAFNQSIKLYTHYSKDELEFDATFEPMETTNEDGSVTTVDHQKLDHVTPQEQQHGAAERRSSRLARLRRGNALLAPLRRISGDALACTSPFDGSFRNGHASSSGRWLARQSSDTWCSASSPHRRRPAHSAQRHFSADGGDGGAGCAGYACGGAGGRDLDGKAAELHEPSSLFRPGRARFARQGSGGSIVRHRSVEFTDSLKALSSLIFGTGQAAKQSEDSPIDEQSRCGSWRLNRGSSSPPGTRHRYSADSSAPAALAVV